MSTNECRGLSERSVCRCDPRYFNRVRDQRTRDRINFFFFVRRSRRYADGAGDARARRARDRTDGRGEDGIRADRTDRGAAAGAVWPRRWVTAPAPARVPATAIHMDIFSSPHTHRMLSLGATRNTMDHANCANSLGTSPLTDIRRGVRR